MNRETVERLEEDYQRGHQVDGVTFVRHKELVGGNIRYATDDDNALHTGTYLAAAAYRQAVDPSAKNLTAVMRALRGIRLLTSVSGTPGVLARWVFPLDGSFERIGYDREKSLVDGNSYGPKIRSGQLYERNGYAFHTKTTRDQISGVLFGLTAAHVLVPEAHSMVKEIIGNLHTRFRETGWSLVDHEGRTGTSAHQLDAPLRLIVKALHRRTHGFGKLPNARFFRWIWLVTIHYNRIITNTYSFGLNLLDAHALMLLRGDHAESKGVRKWHDRLWCFIRKDENPHFAGLHRAATGALPSAEASENLERRGREPYRKFFSWSRPPEEWWGNPNSTKQGPGIDVLLPYWMNEFYKEETGDG